MNPISTLSNKQKTQLIQDIRAKHHQIKLKVLFKVLKLNRKTYYDNVKNRINQADKYALVKEKIQEIYYGYEGQETYGYRPMWGALRDEGFKISLETVRKLMRSLGIKTTIYHKNTGKYSSYKGNVGKKATNILNQTFDETTPL